MHAHTVTYLGAGTLGMNGAPLEYLHTAHTTGQPGAPHTVVLLNYCSHTVQLVLRTASLKAVHPLE